eukprot:7981259-Alexandrium_andersonii.AAC.1
MGDSARSIVDPSTGFVLRQVAHPEMPAVAAAAAAVSVLAEAPPSTGRGGDAGTGGKSLREGAR